MWLKEHTCILISFSRPTGQWVYRGCSYAAACWVFSTRTYRFYNLHVCSNIAHFYHLHEWTAALNCLRETSHPRKLFFDFYFLPWNRYVALWNYSASFQGCHCTAEFLHLHSPRPVALSLCANNSYLYRKFLLSGGLLKKLEF